MNDKEYVILSSASKTSLSALVSARLNDDWELWGDTFFDGRMYCQAMTTRWYAGVYGLD